MNSYRNIGPCSTTLTPDQITQQILTQLMTSATLWLDFCQYNLPPCKNTPRKIIKIDIPICWKIVLIYEDEQEPDNNVYWSLPCDDDAYCSTEHQYCVDKFGVKHHTYGSYLGYNFPPDCTLEGYEIVKPDEVDEESECYILHTQCNP